MGFGGHGGGFGGGGQGGGDGGRGRRQRVRPTRPAWPILKRSMGLLWPHRILVAGYLITIGLVSLVGLGPPLITGRVVGDAITGHKSGELDFLIVLWVVFIGVGALLGVLQSYLNNLTAQTVMFDLRDR